MKLLILFLSVLFLNYVYAEVENEKQIFTGTWASSQYSNGEVPPISLSFNSLRQIVRISVGGDKFRFHFSNNFGEISLDINEIHVALPSRPGSLKINMDTDTVITFNGEKVTYIRPYQSIVSDVIDFKAPPLSELVISIYFGYRIPKTLTGHAGARTNSYASTNNIISAEKFPLSYTFPRWYFISAIDVLTSDLNSKAVVCFGDSITDGRGTTLNAQNRWTDIFATRLQNYEPTKNISVLNQAIGGTTLIGTSKNIVYPQGEERFQRDVLDQTNVKYLIILYGVNDILYSNYDDVAIINTYKKLIKKAHENGITAYGGTILPFRKNQGASDKKEEYRQKINDWIMNTSPKLGGFDGYIDFAKPMEDPTNSTYLNPEWNFESDGLHPNYIGYEVMGNTVDLDLFTKTSDYLGVKANETEEAEKTSSYIGVEANKTEISTITTTTAASTPTTTTTKISISSFLEETSTTTLEDNDKNSEKDGSLIITPSYFTNMMLIIMIIIFLLH
ncbi:SGNH hydrolase [Neocallimastix sp. 'constans']|jgi:lysophospholipase L1-like esterase